ncbi:MAG: aldehyde dehydrogenase family protein [Terrimicrobiaceae bacterium]
MSAPLPNYLDGTFQPAVAGTTRDFLNPADNSVLGQAAESSHADASMAIDAARRAFDEGAWPTTPAAERASKLFQLADLIDKNAEEFARRDTLNNGKPLREARFDAADAAACFRYFAGLATKPHGESIDLPDPNMICQTIREPVGVCGQIIPWNYPLLMAAWKLAPGLAAGNCCLLKPSEHTPWSVALLFELIDGIGFPPGSVQLLYGAGDPVGSALAASEKVDKIAFTGGTVTGRKIMMAATGNLKRVSLELGGKSPLIVFEDIDRDVALEFALFGIYAGQGEVCNAGSRILVQKSVFEEFAARFAEAAAKIVVGAGCDETSEMGPLITKAHQQKVLDLIGSGRDEGAKLLVGGGTYSDDRRAGNFVQPTAFVDAPPGSRIVREEIFGPVAVLIPFEDEEDAVRLANDTPYGLAGAVFTSDGGRAQRVIRRIRAGVTWINAFHFTFNEAPWGGYKQSGFGRELGTHGYDAYTEVKQITTNLRPTRLGWYSNI